MPKRFSWHVRIAHLSGRLARIFDSKSFAAAIRRVTEQRNIDKQIAFL